MTKPNEDIKLIFIAGYPRSGTTWFANLINAHPSVIYRHEVLGRCFSSFPVRLFEALKSDHGLNDSDYKTVIDIICSSRVETDRPPFFEKNYLWINSPKVHQIFWLVSKFLSLFRPFYQFLFMPRSQQKIISIKETRSSADMESMIEGLRTYKNVFLFRHPCGCIASSLAGIQSGKMSTSTKGERKFACKEFLESKAIRGIGLTEADILSMPEHEYLAVLWRIQNNDYINFKHKFGNNIFISYENFMQSSVENSKKLFADLSLSFDKNAEEFITSSSRAPDNLSILNKDSGSSFYSVYRKSGFNPDKWKESLTAEQIKSIEHYTLETYNEMLSLDATITAGIR